MRNEATPDSARTVIQLDKQPNEHFIRLAILLFSAYCSLSPCLRVDASTDLGLQVSSNQLPRFA